MAPDRVFFSADTHYGHSNILEYSGRPFKTVEEMNEEMIRRWNDVVKKGDRVYFLGDFCLGSDELAHATVRRLNGQKFIIWGNHDKRLRKDKTFCSFFIKNGDLDQIEVEGQKIILCHYAMKTWNQSHRGSWNLHGHSHGSLAWDPGSLQIDVGVDCWDYTPVSFEQVKEKMSGKTWKPIDHHGQRPGEVGEDGK